MVFESETSPLLLARGPFAVLAGERSFVLVSQFERDIGQADFVFVIETLPDFVIETLFAFVVEAFLVLFSRTEHANHLPGSGSAIIIAFFRVFKRLIIQL